MDYRIRLAEESDACAVRDIYKYYVDHTIATFDINTPDEQYFKEHIVRTLETYPFLVAENSCGEVLGYAYASPLKDREAYNFSCETTIYLKHGIERNGLGTLLYEELENLLRKQNIKNLYACIAYPYLISQAFHEKQGYRVCAHFNRCGRKFGSWLDVIWMEKQANAAEYESTEPFIPFKDFNMHKTTILAEKDKGLKISRVGHETKPLPITHIEKDDHD